jgi:hypothetical protein
MRDREFRSSAIGVARGIAALVVVASACLSAPSVDAQTTAFTYQGRLTDGGAPATGAYDLRFRLFPDAAGVVQIGGDVLRDDVAVAAGLFTVGLDFGSSPFTGDAAHYLEIAVRPGASSGAYTPLTARQPLTSSPYAIATIRAASAAAADVAADASHLGGLTASQFARSDDARLSDARPPTAGSASYIQNSTGQQAASNFSISGDGAVAGTLSGNTVTAATQYKLGGERILSTPGPNTNNLVVGVGAGPATASGAGNSIFGALAGQLTSTGFGNSFFGAQAGANADSHDNSFFGYSAGLTTTAGGDNTFIGYVAGRYNTSGSNNTFIGSGAGETNSGNNNTVIGFAADVTGFLFNATALGANAIVAQSNSLVLGSGVNVGIGTSAPKTKLHIAGGSAYIASPNSLIITSPNGSCWFLTVSNTGVVSSSTITCP